MFKPLSDRVAIKRLDPDTVSKGGILIPDAATEKPERGEVLAVGPGKYEDGDWTTLSVKVGDKVLFGKYSGQTVKLDGEEILVMREDDIMGIIG